MDNFQKGTPVTMSQIRAAEKKEQGNVTNNNVTVNTTQCYKCPFREVRAEAVARFAKRTETLMSARESIRVFASLYDLLTLPPEVEKFITELKEKVTTEIGES